MCHSDMDSHDVPDVAEFAGHSLINSAPNEGVAELDAISGICQGSLGEPQCLRTPGAVIGSVQVINPASLAIFTLTSHGPGALGVGI